MSYNTRNCPVIEGTLPRAIEPYQSTQLVEVIPPTIIALRGPGKLALVDETGNYTGQPVPTVNSILSVKNSTPQEDYIRTDLYQLQLGYYGPLVVDLPDLSENYDFAFGQKKLTKVNYEETF